MTTDQVARCCPRLAFEHVFSFGSGNKLSRFSTAALVQRIQLGYSHVTDLDLIEAVLKCGRND